MGRIRRLARHPTRSKLSDRDSRRGQVTKKSEDISTFQLVVSFLGIVALVVIVWWNMPTKQFHAKCNGAELIVDADNFEATDNVRGCIRFTKSDKSVAFECACDSVSLGR